jgi:hypothetical protein
MAVDYFAGNDYDIGIALQSAQGVAADASQFRTFVTAGGVMPVKDTSPIEETTDERLLTDDYVAGVRAEGGPAARRPPEHHPAAALRGHGREGGRGRRRSVHAHDHARQAAAVLHGLDPPRRLRRRPVHEDRRRKIGSLSLASSANGLLMATPTSSAPARPRGAAEATASIEAAGTAFLHADGSGALKIETVAVATIEQQELTIDNGAALQTGDSVEGYAVTEARQTITWATTMLVQDFDLWRRYLYGTRRRPTATRRRATSSS